MAYLGEILAALLLLVLLAALLWKYSARLNGANRSFYAAVNEWEEALGVQTRYDTPWLLMLGDAPQIEALLTGWGLTSVAQPAWFGRWWYGPDGAVLVVPAALFSHGERASVQLKLWRQLLELLVQARANRPADGIIWLCDLEQLTPDQDTAAAGLAARRKFVDVQQRLGLSLPVYMLLSGFDSLPGSSELLEVLPVAAKGAPLGWTSPYTAQTPWHPDWINQGLGQLEQAMADLLVEIGTLRGQVGAELYLLPRQLQALHDPMRSLCDPVFQANAMGEAPRLRGLYFSAQASRAAPAADADPFAEGPTPIPAPPLFTPRLWRQRIIAEQGLAQPVARILQVRQRSQQLVAVAVGVIGLFWVIGMLWAWHGRSDAATQLSALLHEDQLHNPVTDDDAARRERIASFWQLLQASPRWHMGTSILPGSWFSALDQQLAQELRSRARVQLFTPLKGRLQDELNNLIAPRTVARPRAGSSNNEEAYRQAMQVLDQALAVESHNKRFAQSVQGDQRPLDDAIALANDLLGLNFQTKGLPLGDDYNHLLATAEVPLASPLQLDPVKPQIATRYVDSMRLWLDSLFASSDFTTTAAALNSQLQALQGGQRNSLAELEELDASVVQLRQLLALTNAAWSQGNGAQLAPGYQESLEKARQSALIGVAAVDKVESYAASSKGNFHDRWLAKGDEDQAILRQQSSGGLELQTNVDKLGQVVSALLHQDFSQMALNQDDAPPLNGQGLRELDGGKLDAALHYHDSYQLWLQQNVAELPSPYRKALIAAARSATSIAMWQSLNSVSSLGTSKPAEADRGTTFNLPADKALQVLQVFSDIGDTRQTEALRQELNTRALNDLHRSMDEIDALPLFRQPIDFSQWDGTRNLSLRAFRENDPQALKQDLNRQFTLIGDSLSTARPAIEWLDQQRDRLSPSDDGILDSFVDMNAELKKYSDQNPASSPLQYQQMVLRDFNDMDLGNCAKTLSDSILPMGRGNIAQLARSAHDRARQRCDSLQNYTAAVAWKRLDDYFRTYLAGRFPFSDDSTPVDANPDRVREFLDLIDKNLPSAFSGLENNHSAKSSAAAEFLFNLQNARAWLGPLLLRDKDGVRGLDLEIRWRTDRDEERGADQVIDWNLATGARVVSYPAENLSHANWTVGEPVRLALRWAKGSNQRPQDAPAQSALAVADLQASWSYEGAWALLRFIHAHQAGNHFTTQDEGDRPLALQLPLRSPLPGNADALMFLRLSLKAVGGKQPLILSTLPTRVPASPYGSVFPLPVASTEIQP
ncbi:type VI secretion system protein ImpL [Pseudomonas gingeri]|uniref:type VI secretion system protein n=1 Tax=Pseudomonas gingeri TaxID=117681 RepID=UPI0015A4B448|nr:type VI secretion protein IcmF/TssM N-terminal domain-containing protein [Pseudomonas gingeri]NWD71831.1 type VI secretion system protein ImpL [Pseudomonas gingeri]